MGRFLNSGSGNLMKRIVKRMRERGIFFPVGIPCKIFFYSDSLENRITITYT